MRLGAEDLQACLVVLGTLETEIQKLNTGSRVREMFEDWVGMLYGQPRPFALPWGELPPISPPRQPPSGG